MKRQRPYERLMRLEVWAYNRWRLKCQTGWSYRGVR